MIHVSNEDIDLYTLADLWGQDSQNWTLGGLLEQRTKETPDALALCDAPDRERWTSGEARQLTFKDLNDQASILADFLDGLNLPSSSVIGVCGGNTVELYVSVLAIHGLA